MKYGILDFGAIANNSNAISTIHETIEMVQLAEELNFSRYWLAEHHEDGVAWKSPDIILPLLAGYTENIRIGSAGVLIGLNSPIKTAHNYKLLANLYPNRIDLGLAKGTADSHICKELSDGANYPENLKNYYQRVEKVNSFLKDQIENIILPPITGESPEIWILGTSKSSNQFVIDNKFCYSLSLFHLINNVPTSDIIKELKENYLKKHGELPKVNVAITAYCSNDKQKVQNLLENTKNVHVNFAGTPNELVNYTKKLAQEYEIDEIIINNLGKTYDEKLELMNALKELSFA